MKRLTSAEILVNDRLNGKRENASLLKRAVLEFKGDDCCEQCKQSFDPAKLKVYRIYDRVLDNRPENLTMLCSGCLKFKTKKNYWKPSRQGMNMIAVATEHMMKQEDLNVFKILDDVAKNGF